MSISDALLWEKWRARRDADAFTEIVSRHAGMVYATCRRVLANGADAEEVAQECFLELIHARLRVPGSLAPWLHAVARRRALDRLKMDRRRRERERRFIQKNKPGKEAGVGEILALVDRAISELPEKLRAPVLLRFLEGKTQADVARSLGLPESTISSRLKRAVEKIRSSLRRRGVKVSAGALAASLTGNLCEPAPPALTASLGKLALASPGRAVLKSAGVASSLHIGKVAAALVLLGILCLVGVLLVQRLNEQPDVRQLAGEPPPTPGDPPAVPAAGIREEPSLAMGKAARSEAPVENDGEKRWLKVLCVDAEGSPVAGAEVLVAEDFTPGSADADRSAGPPPAVTDRSGLARFGFPRREDVWRLGIFARLDDTLAGFDSPGVDGIDPDRPVEITLLESRELVGLVGVPPEYDPRRVTVLVTNLHIDADGLSPLWDDWNLNCDESKAAHGRWREIFTKRPNSDAEFRFPHLPAAARIGLIAEGPELGRGHFSVKSPWPDDPVILELYTEGVIEGTLTYEDTGEPGAGIPLEAASHSRGHYRTTVDGDGRFRFSCLPESMYHISLPTDFDTGGWTMAVRSFVRASPGVVTEDVHLKLERGIPVTGRVTNALTGEPIRTRVAATGGRENGTRPVGYASTDEQGRYSLLLPRGPSRIYICERDPRYIHTGEYTEKDIVIARGETARDGIDFVLPPRSNPPSLAFGYARGRVLDPHGVPMAGVEVETFVLHDPRAHYPSVIFNRSTTTDAEGRYELLVAASRKFYIRGGGSGFSTAGAGPLEVEEEGIREVMDLIVRRGKSFVAGQVVDEQGNPLPEVSVFANSPSRNPGGGGEPVRTDPEGLFRLEQLLEDEPLQVTASKAGYENVRLPEVLPGSENLRIVLKRLEGALFHK